MTGLQNACAIVRILKESLPEVVPDHGAGLEQTDADWALLDNQLIASARVCCAAVFTCSFVWQAS